MPVKGYLRSIIYDIQRGDSYFIPNAMLSFIKKINKKNLMSELIVKYINKGENSNYLNFLLDNELVFFTGLADKNLFPNIDENYESPEFLYKLDICLNDKLNVNFLNNILDKFNLSIINIRVNFSKQENILDKFLEEIRYSTLRNINLYFDDTIFNYDMLKYFKTEKRINLIYLSFKLEHIEVLKEYKNKIFVYNSFKNTSNLSSSSFVIETNVFLESQNNNTYYNKSLYIDSNNNISNSLLYETFFGNVNEIKSINDFLFIIKTEEFQKYWHISKSSLDICKVCEFRYMCIDSRVPIQRKKNEWFFEIECNYNPFIAKWKGEKGYKNLKECGIVSNLNEFKVNQKKLNKINRELWEEA